MLSHMTIWLGLLFGFRVISAFETTRRGALKSMASSSILASASIASEALMEEFSEEQLAMMISTALDICGQTHLLFATFLASIAARTTASISTMQSNW